MLRNLAYRESNGITVSLDWESDIDEVIVTVVDCGTLNDSGSENAFRFLAPRNRALDAFEHPYFYFACTSDPASVSA